MQRFHVHVFARIGQALFLFIFCGCLVFGQGANSKTPLLERELFFAGSEIINPQLSPDGRKLAFQKPQNKAVWVKGLHDPFSIAKPISEDAVQNFAWSGDGKYLLLSQNNTLQILEVPNPKVSASIKGDLKNFKLNQARLLQLVAADADTIIIGSNERNDAWPDVYQVKLSTGERQLLSLNLSKISSWIFDQKGQPRFGVHLTDDGGLEVMRLDGNSSEKIYDCSVHETCLPVRIHKDGKRLYLQTNRGENADLTRLVLLDPETGNEEVVSSDPQNRVDYKGAFFSEISQDLMGTMYEGDRPRISFNDKIFEADYKILKRELVGQEVSILSASKNERIWIVNAYSDTEPGQVFMFDRNLKSVKLLYRSHEKLNRQQLVGTQSFRYKTSDGLEVSAYLTVPKNVVASNLPLIVLPHNKAWTRASWGYDATVQFLANRGYAVLQSNVRSSSGFGKKYFNAGNQQWGEKVQTDLREGVKFLVDSGIVDQQRVGIMGSTFGGYSALAGVAFSPEVYAAGVSISGPVNLVNYVDSLPANWNSGRSLYAARVGDSSSEEGKKQLLKQSPASAVAQIKAPIMIVQGANDRRMNQKETDEFVDALTKQKILVQYFIAADEGHGLTNPENQLAVMAAAEQFFAKHLRGQAQVEIRPELTARLQNITNTDIQTKVSPLENQVAVNAKSEFKEKIPEVAPVSVEAAAPISESVSEVEKTKENSAVIETIAPNIAPKETEKSVGTEVKPEIAQTVINPAPEPEAKPEVKEELIAKSEPLSAEPVTAPMPVTTIKKSDPVAIRVVTRKVGLSSSIHRYNAKIEMGQQLIPVTIQTEIRENDNDQWVASEVMETPQGTVIETSILDKKSLQVLNRSMRQGAYEFDLSFSNKKVTGTQKLNETHSAITGVTEGEIFADGAGIQAVIASLPLSEGYTKIFRNFDEERQKSIVKKLTVVSTESIKITLGEFKTFRVSITGESGEEMVFWVDKESRNVVKFMKVLTKMGGAKLTGEMER